MLTLLGRLLTRRLIDHPIVVVGAGRSGTTALTRALGQHPAVLSFLAEGPVIDNVGGFVHDFEFGEARDYYLAALRVPKAYLYQQMRRIALESVAGKYYGLKLHAKHLVTRGDPVWRKRFWCVKAFPNQEVSDALMRLFPAVKFVYIVRNGIHVVHSRTKYHGFSGQSFRKNCLDWAHSIQAHDYLRDSEHAMLVRQEALVDDPEPVFQELLAFLGLAPHRGPVEFIKSNIVHPAEAPTGDPTDLKQFYQQRHNVYDDWTTEQKAIFRETCAEAMRESGYGIPF